MQELAGFSPSAVSWILLGYGVDYIEFTLKNPQVADNLLDAVTKHRAGSEAERQSRSPVTPVTKASRPPPGVTSPHAVIFHSFAVPPASTSSKPVDVSTL